MSAEGFAEQLRRLRMAAGMTQEGLAERSGLSVRGISDLERGVKQRPHPETVRMLADALNLSPELHDEFKASATPRSTLSPIAFPEPLTALVDREDELHLLVSQVLPDSGNRLVTLTGPGGVGKTRLSIRVANEVREQFADDAAFVPLAGLSEPRLVLPTLARTLGIRDLSNRSPLNLLIRNLHDRQLLIVMDNFEHLLPAAADLAALLSGCRNLTVLATSRSPLHITGEREFQVRPLQLPDPSRAAGSTAIAQSPAVVLFVQQARAVSPQFDVTDANAHSVAAICTHVDGLPLALELAAVRTKTLSTDELEALLDNRLGLLTGGPQDHPVRHRTVRATIGWSHDLLDVADQVAFRRFAVFPVGARLEAAVAVIAPGNALKTLDHLTALLDQSLLQRFEGADGHPRFVMLETIREFAMDQLTASEDEDEVRNRHANWFLQVAEQGEIELTGPDQAAWMARLETEYGNLRAALDWSIQCGDAHASQRFGSALWRFWSASGRLREGRDWLDQALVLEPEDRSPIRAQALLRRGNIAVEMADYPSASSLYEASLSIRRALHDSSNTYAAILGLGLVHWSQGDYSAARAAHESALSICQTQGWNAGVALALQNIGNVAVAEGDYAAARDNFDASLAIRRELDDTGGMAWAAYWRGRLERLEGNFDDARRWLIRAQAGFREVDYILGIAFTLNELGCLAHDLRDDRAAMVYHLHALRERDEAGDIQGMVECLEGISAVALAQGQFEEGVTLAATASTWRASHGVPLLPILQRAWDKALDEARSALPEATFKRAWGDGETLPIDTAIDLANGMSLPPEDT